MSLSAESRQRVRTAVSGGCAPVSMGRVVRVAGLLIEANLKGVSVGDIAHVVTDNGDVPCEVVGFREGRTLAIPLGDVHGVAAGAWVRRSAGWSKVRVGRALCGRVVDAFGRAIDGGPRLVCSDQVAIDRDGPALHERGQVDARFDTGVRVIDGLLTCGRGQRMGIFAGAGVGKSMLVEQIASNSTADVTVVGLVGERGREVRELMANVRGDSTVIVAATSDRSPMERVRGAQTATAIAEYFRDRGAQVLLIVDSLTRYAMALREIGLARGEPPATKGYPPSVFAALPRLLERVCPMSAGGSITAFYTVLVEGDDLSDPVADSARSLLDGHIVLSREMAGRGQFPAVDVLASSSRVALQVTEPSCHELMQTSRSVLSQCELIGELRSLGAYVPGQTPEHDQALQLGSRLEGFARQAPSEHSSYDDTIARLTDALTKEEAGA